MKKVFKNPLKLYLVGLLAVAVCSISFFVIHGYLDRGILGAAVATSSGTSTAEVGDFLPEQLFDIDLKLDRRTLTSADELVARAVFISFGRVPTPVDATFSIRDSEGVVQYSDTTTVTVETELIYPKRFPELTLTPGSYTLELDTLYNADVSDHFEQEFRITEPEDEQNFLLLVGGSLIGALIFFGVFLYLLKIRHVHTSALPVTGIIGLMFAIFGVMLPVSTRVFTYETKDVAARVGGIYEAQRVRLGDEMEELRAVIAKAQNDTLDLYKVISNFEDPKDMLLYAHMHAWVAGVYVESNKGTCTVSARRSSGFETRRCARIPHKGLHAAPDGRILMGYRIPRHEGGAYILTQDITQEVRDLTRLSRSDERLVVLDEHARPLLEYEQRNAHPDALLKVLYSYGTDKLAALPEGAPIVQDGYMVTRHTVYDSYGAAVITILGLTRHTPQKSIFDHAKGILGNVSGI